MRCKVEAVQDGPKWAARTPSKSIHSYSAGKSNVTRMNSKAGADSDASLAPREGMPHYSLEHLQRERKYHNSVIRERDMGPPATPDDGFVSSLDGAVLLKKSNNKLAREKSLHDADIVSSPRFLRSIAPAKEDMLSQVEPEGPQRSQRAFSHMKRYHDTDVRASPRRENYHPVKHVRTPETSQKMLQESKRTCQRGVGGRSVTL